MRSPSLLAVLSLAVSAGCTESGSGIKVHNDPPTASITGPEDGAELLEGDVVTLTGSVYDSKGYSKLEWRAGSTVICDLDSAPPSEDGETACDWTVDGSATITLWVEDTQGADAEDSLSIVMVDNGTPTIDIVSPDGSATLYADIPVELSALVGDDRDSADALEVLWQLDGAALSVIGANVSSDGVASGSASLPAGNYMVSAQVTDSLGKQSSDSVTVKVFDENTIPECSILATPDRAATGETVTLSGTASDTQTAAGLLVTSLSSSVDGALTDALTVATGGSWTWPTDTLSAGTHVITLTVTDDYGDTCIKTATVEICGDVWYTDADGDTYGDPGAAMVACDQPSDTVGNADDCDDADPFTYMGAAENESSTACMTDADLDGYGDSGAIAPVTPGTDCDDADTAIHPDADEVCDTTDNDCDGLVDDADTDVDVSTGATFYVDADSDGYGDVSSPVQACVVPSGAVADATDCDDTESAMNPGESEVCDGLDNNCDSTIDEGVTTTYYQDADSDGFGDASTTTEDCSVPSGFVTSSTDCLDTDADTYPGAAATDSPSDCMTDSDGDGYGDLSPHSDVSAGTDCDDGDSSIHPAASEACDSIDNDCDGDIDDADSSLDTSTADAWYADADNDGFGDASVSTLACVQPSGTVADDTDCDDADVFTYPGIAVSDSTTSCMTDSDGDGYGDIGPAAGVSAGTDCDDTDRDVSPDATEECDSIDNDCDGNIDDDDSSLDTTTADTWYADTDSDGFGDASVSSLACAQPSGTVADATDCDDTDFAVHPDATEVCDASNVDEDCSGSADDLDAGVEVSTQTAWYTDSDVDGYGDAAGAATMQCDAPSGSVSDNTDCDDSDSAVNPGATEVCDASNVDEDCSGTADDLDAGVDVSTQTAWYTDSDVDGYGDASVAATMRCDAPSGSVSDNTDCDDSDSAVNPGATEVCDASNVDEDCSGTADDLDAGVDVSTQTAWYTDSDVDGYGDDSATATVQCDAPSGSVADNTDCDDSDSAIHPGATEVCDAGSVDEDCNGTADDLDSGVDVSSQTAWYTDSDLDGYGDAASSTLACIQPSGTVGDDTDCDDAVDTIHPAALEICDGLDNNCNGDTDLGLCGELFAADADLSFTGQNAGDHFSSSIAMNGDLNGDGFPELIVGASLFDNTGTGDGAAYVFMGPVTAGGAAGGAEGVLLGMGEDQMGNFVDAGGDLNGDGYDDMVVCESKNDGLASNAGAAWIVYGPVTGSFSGGISSYADAVLQGAYTSDYACYAGRIVEDFTGDGLDELFVSVYFADNAYNAAGEGVILNGSTTARSGSSNIDSSGYATRFEGVGTGDYVGNTMSEGGDINGDGTGDLLMGAHGYDGKGAALLQYGPVTGMGNVYITDADVRFIGRDTGDNAGWRISTAGDATGDGQNDILMSATTAYDSAGTTRGGAAYLFSDGTYAGDVTAASYDAVIYGDASNDQLGHGLSLADVDGDGVADAILAAPHVSSYTGAIYVVYGPLSGSYDAATDADVEILGDSAGPSFGTGIAVGDLDQDGILDFASGSPATHSSPTNKGTVNIFFGGLD